MTWAKDRWWADCVVEGGAALEARYSHRVEVRLVHWLEDLEPTVRFLMRGGRRREILITTRDVEASEAAVARALDDPIGDSRRIRLGALVHTQDGLARSVSELVGGHVGLRTVVLEPHEELDLRAGGVLCTRIDWIVLRGPCEPRDVAMHPKWVDRIIGDARRLEVPIWWESWGRWVPHRSGERRRHQDVVAVYESGAMEPCRGIAGSAPLGAVMMRDDPGAKAPELHGWESAQEPRMEATT